MAEPKTRAADNWGGGKKLGQFALGLTLLGAPGGGPVMPQVVPLAPQEIQPVK